MEHRAILGPVDGRAATRQKILAADGLIGIVIMLAYYKGGTNLFPHYLDPNQYLLDQNARGSRVSGLQTDLELLTKLQNELGEFLERKFGEISASSVPVYLTRLGRGQRANGNGSLPQIKVEYSARTQELIIPGRNFSEDELKGITADLPTWIKLGANEPKSLISSSPARGVFQLDDRDAAALPATIRRERG